MDVSPDQGAELGPRVCRAISLHHPQLLAVEGTTGTWVGGTEYGKRVTRLWQHTVLVSVRLDAPALLALGPFPQLPWLWFSVSGASLQSLLTTPQRIVW